MAAPAPPSEQLVEVLWRCEACGKWSHAKRRPRSHERFVKAADLTPSDLLVREDHSTDEFDGGWVQCGPFARWNATRVEFR